MTRLNKDIKAKILQNAINAAPVTKRLEELNAMKYQLAVDIYDSVTKGHNPEEYAAQLNELAQKSPFYLGLIENKTDVAEQDYIFFVRLGDCKNIYIFQRTVKPGIA